MPKKAKTAARKPAKKSTAKRSIREVVTRFKTTPGKRPEALKKPRPERAPRGIDISAEVKSYIVPADTPVYYNKKIRAAIAERATVVVGVDPGGSGSVVVKGGNLLRSAIEEVQPKFEAALKAATAVLAEGGTAVEAGTAAHAAIAAVAKRQTKAGKLEAMLRAGAGVTAAEAAEQLEWTTHATRAAISRLGVEVTTEKKDGVTVYRIAADAPAKVKTMVEAVR